MDALEQQSLFEDDGVAVVADAKPARVAPCYVWPSAVPEWEAIRAELLAKGYRGGRLERLTNREFCRRSSPVTGPGVNRG